YVFVLWGTLWPQRQELFALDGGVGDQFGTSVAISGTNALMGAPDKNASTGAAYAFVVPSEQAELSEAGGAFGDFFGVSVAVSGTTAIVGADGRNGTGAAYVFVR